MNKSAAIFLLLLLLAAPQLAWPQAEIGIPLMRTYAPTVYNANPQNWQIRQAGDGRILVGNTAGLMSYDGVAWQSQGLPERPAVYSLAQDDSGTVWVGGYQQFGRMAMDSSGKMQFEGFHTALADSLKNFGAVWRVLPTAEGVYFVTRQHVFRHTPGTNHLRAWTTTSAFLFGFQVHSRLYFPHDGIGLTTMTGDTLQLIPGGGLFADMRVHEMIPFPIDSSDLQSPPHETLIVTYAHGLFSFDGSAVSRFATEADDLLKRAIPVCAAGLRDGRIAIGTLNNGVILLDRRGNCLQVLDTDAGLLSDKIHGMYEDREGGLWLAHNNGISRVETATPVAVFGKQQGFSGLCYDLVRHRGDLYAATDVGVQRLEKSAGERTGKWLPLSHRGLGRELWAMLSRDQSLFIAGLGGVSVVDGQTVRRLLSTPTYILAAARKDSSVIYAGTENGVSILKFDASEGPRGRWTNGDKIAGITERVWRLAEDNRERLWISPYTGNVLRIDRMAGHGQRHAIARFDSSDGLPYSTGEVDIFLIGDHLYFGTRDGLMIFDEQSSRFVPDTTLSGALPNRSLRPRQMTVDMAGNLWFTYYHQRDFLLGMLSGNENTGYTFIEGPLGRIKSDGTPQLFIDSNQDIWFGWEQILRINPAFTRQPPVSFRTLVRQVTTSGDSVIYRRAVDGRPPVLSYARNALRFEFAAPTFNDETATRYQYFLENFDDGWSTWIDETKKDYTNLSEGTYRFRVRARNSSGYLGEEGTYSFEILPPWYRTPWMYFLYAIALVTMVMALVRWRSRQLEHEKRQLEHIISEKTAEIQAQSERLQEMDRLKSRFFANISHEFRTPLTLIIDPLQEMAARRFKGNANRQYDMMLRNARRLLQLINQLLDLSRLESGAMKLQLQPIDFIGFLRGIVYSFESAAHRKNITLRFDSQIAADSIAALVMEIDRDKLEKVFFNLLSNALKFTPDGGTIRVAVAFDADGESGRIGERERRVVRQNDRQGDEASGRTGERERRVVRQNDRQGDEASGRTGERERRVVRQNDRQGDEASGRTGERERRGVRQNDRQGEDASEPERRGVRQNDRQGDEASERERRVVRQNDRQGDEASERERRVVRQNDRQGDEASERERRVVRQNDRQGEDASERERRVVRQNDRQGDEASERERRGVRQNDRQGDEASERERRGVRQNDRQGESVSGRTGEPVEYVQITVSDSGIGIPADRLPYIFDRFYQVDATETREHEGSGIGLALTRELVTLHGGRIAVTSEAEKGTTFTLHLPGRIAADAVVAEAAMVNAPAARPAAETGASEKPAGARQPAAPEEVDETALPNRLADGPGPMILVVEDNDDVRQYLRIYLDPLYKVLEAPDGRAGLQAALAHIPDLIISDVMMPHMDGIELCRRLKSDVRTSHIPVIMLTARAEDHDRIGGLQTGVDDYLVKPFNSRELQVRIKNLIELRRKLQEKYRREFLSEPRDVTVTSMEDQFLAQAVAVVEAHMGDPGLSVEQLAGEMAMSRTSLHRKISALTGQPATLFIRSLRLKRAAQLLRQHGGTITEIAFDVGFTSSAYFTKCFREQYGKSPRKYQKSSG